MATLTLKLRKGIIKIELILTSFEQVKNESDRRKQDLDKGVFESVKDYSEKSGNKSGDNSFIANKGANGRACDVHTEQSQSNGDGNIGKS